MTSNTIDAKTLKRWLDAKEAVLIDVREPDEYDEQHIPGSFLQPLAVVSAQGLPKHTNKKIVVHCKAGRRGGMACEKLLAQNPKLEVYNLDGGITSWIDEGYRVESNM